MLVVLFTAPDTRIVRSAVLEQRPLPYIDAARTLGISKARILFVHILPNVLPIVLAYVVLDFAFALVNLAGLSFLGLGVEPGTPDWGRMLFENRNILFSNPVALLLPAAMIILTAVSMNLIGDWLFERLDASERMPRAAAVSEPLLESRARDLGAAARATITTGTDLDVGRGETIAIVGESGSGKSLTAKAIARLLPPGVSADGAVTLRRHRPDGARRSARCSGCAAGASRCCCRTRSRC